MIGRPNRHALGSQLPFRATRWQVLPVACLILPLFLFGCGANVSKAESLTAEQSVALLERADEITESEDSDD